jgi:cytochrome c peroxidase
MLHRKSRAGFSHAIVPLLFGAALFHAATALAQTPPPAPNNDARPRIEILGQRLFTDHTLSEPAGLACITCHGPNNGFAGNNGSRIGVAAGSRPGVFGLRNSMSNAYNAFVPAFTFQLKNGGVEAVGGHFWDGRADTLAAQAMQPFLAAAEMNNPDAASVVKKVAASNYANLMRAEFGARIFESPELAFQKIGEAIAAFESSAALQAFSSKYDQFIQGKVELSANESRGMQLFIDPAKGNCASCHRMNPATKNPRDSLFTDFAYYATGIPRNPAIPQNANPSFFDLGLCGPQRSRPALGSEVPAGTSIEKFCGTFRVVTLRNVAERRAFMHNGVFRNLREVVGFYATRNANPQRWYGPAGVPNDLPAAYVGNILNDRPPFNRPRAEGPALTPGEVDDIVAFLHTLSDAPSAPPAAAPPGPQASLLPFGRR